MKILTKVYSTIFYLIKRLLALVEIFLFLRLSLKFLSANPKALVVNLIYQGSDFLITPFNFIFPNIYWRKAYLIETTTLSAMVGYGIAAFFLFYFLRLLSRD